MSAHVLVKLEVEVSVGAWNEAATFASLREQVNREAVQKLTNKLSKDRDFRVIGKPVSTRIVLDGQEGA